MIDEMRMENTVLFTRIYDDALELLHLARDYVQQLGPIEIFVSSPDSGVSIATETSRITSRLTQVVAWYLTQKAYHTGEIDLAEARREAYRITSDAELCDTQGEINPILPENIKDLLERSRSLYERTARLDQNFCRNTSH